MPFLRQGIGKHEQKSSDGVRRLLSQAESKRSYRCQIPLLH
jgi:hypothetical protein